jgi:SNF2 family DNA or RNA helicase
VSFLVVCWWLELYLISGSLVILKLFRHLQPGSLKYDIYHGQNRKGIEVLGQYDVVITTYHTVSAIWRKRNDLPGSENSLFLLTWHRVILDEGEGGL